MTKPTYRLDNWYFNGSLHGRVYGSPWFLEGEYVHTSQVVGDQTEFKEGDTAETLNSLYVLGAPLSD